MPEPPRNPEYTTRHLLIALAVVLGAVTAGTLFTMRFEGPRPAHKRTALGHTVPTPAVFPSGEMAWIPGGTFQRGAADGARDQEPVREIKVDGFWIDRTEVTNEEFEKFVTATSYVTTAEQQPNSSLSLPQLTNQTVPGSFVLARAATNSAGPVLSSEWRFVPGANWRHPEGPRSDVRGRARHPVVHVSWLDAVAYAGWSKQRLPTEAEWEFAARGGLMRQKFAWGDDLDWRGSSAPANVGIFQMTNTVGTVVRTSPIGFFPANRYGIYDVAGNVAEWCQDWYRADAYATASLDNPRGPDEGFDPEEPTVAKKVVRGGSFLTANPAELRLTARTKRSPYASYSDVGFRCARSTK